MSTGADPGSTGGRRRRDAMAEAVAAAGQVREIVEEARGLLDSAQLQIQARLVEEGRRLGEMEREVADLVAQRNAAEQRVALLRAEIGRLEEQADLATDEALALVERLAAARDLRGAISS